MAYYNTDNVFPNLDNNNNKFRNIAGLLLYLKRTGQKNAARTHKVFKLGVAILHLSLTLYLIGFLCPFWVVGARHENKDGSEGRDVEEEISGADGSFSADAGAMSVENLTHFGLWEECVVTEGQTACVLFTEDIDSLIIMFATVGLFILASLCGWTLLACVRTQRKRRYVLTVVAAIIGGAFGFVTIFIFIGVQGQKPYSWALVVYFIACILELSAGAIIMWGLIKASTQEEGALDNSLAEAEAAVVGETEETQAQVTRTPLPSIIITEATPKGRKKSKRRVQIALRGYSPAAVGSHGQPLQRVVDFVSLDMVSPLPDQPRTKTDGPRRLEKERKGDHTTPLSSGHLRKGESSAERRGKGVAAATTAAYVQMGSRSTHCERDHRSEPARCRVGTPKHCSLPPQESTEDIEMRLFPKQGEHERQSRITHRQTSTWTHGLLVSSPAEIRAAEDTVRNLPTKQDEHKRRSKQAPRTPARFIPSPAGSAVAETQMCESTNIRLHPPTGTHSKSVSLPTDQIIVDVHQPFSLDAHAVHLSGDLGEIVRPQRRYCHMGKSSKSAENVATSFQSPSSVRKGRKCTVSGEVASPAGAGSKTGLDLSPSATPCTNQKRGAPDNKTPTTEMNSGRPRTAGREHKEKRETEDYVRYSPDTYFQTRGNCYIFKSNDVVKSDD